MSLNNLNSSSAPPRASPTALASFMRTRRSFPRTEAVYYSLRPTCRWAVCTAEGPSHQRIDVRSVTSLPDLVDDVLRLLTAEDEDLAKRVCATDDAQWLKRRRRTRRYFAEERELLYIDNPDLTEQYARQVGSIWMVTNIGQPEARSMLREIGLASSVPIDGWWHLKI